MALWGLRKRPTVEEDEEAGNAGCGSPDESVSVPNHLAGAFRKAMSQCLRDMKGKRQNLSRPQ